MGWHVREELVGNWDNYVWSNVTNKTGSSHKKYQYQDKKKQGKFKKRCFPFIRMSVLCMTLWNVEQVTFKQDTAVFKMNQEAEGCSPQIMQAWIMQEWRFGSGCHIQVHNHQRNQDWVGNYKTGAQHITVEEIIALLGLNHGTTFFTRQKCLSGGSKPHVIPKGASGQSIGTHFEQFWSSWKHLNWLSYGIFLCLPDYNSGQSIEACHITNTIESKDGNPLLKRL